MSKVIIELASISRLLVSFSNHVRNENAMGNFFINSLENHLVEAFENFKKAVSLKTKYIDMAKYDPDFANLKNNPEFIKLLEPCNAGK